MQRSSLLFRSLGVRVPIADIGGLCDGYKVVTESLMTMWMSRNNGRLPLFRYSNESRYLLVFHPLVDGCSNRHGDRVHCVCNTFAYLLYTCPIC